MERVNEAFVAGGHEQVVESAAEILRAGGNAFDAIIAAGFASAVVEPAFTSLGGGGFLLAAPRDHAPRIFDFFVDTPGRGLSEPRAPIAFDPVTIRFPGADQVFHIGPGSVAVPGVLKGYVHAHRALGKLPLNDVLAPAIRYARDGVRVTEMQHRALRLLAPILRHTDRCQQLMAPGGHIPEVGSTLSFPDTASFLETLPKGGLAAFYEGEIAQEIEDEMKSSGGLLTRADLAAYQVFEREPLATTYRGHRVLLNAPPSGGGVRVRGFLQRLEALLPDATGMHPDDPRYVACLAEAIELGERFPPSMPAAPQTSFSRGTTHISVTDHAGNAASMTTSNGEGSAYVVAGTGIMLNNMLGEDDLHPEGFHRDAPGIRVSSMMCPTVVLGTDSYPRWVIGSGGSRRIRTAVFQVVSRVLDFGATVEEAVLAPRIHFDGTQLQVEPGFSDDAQRVLSTSTTTQLWQERSLYFGGVHAVEVNRGGMGDPRRGGASRSIPPLSST